MKWKLHSKSFKSSKAHGLDGLTVEVLRGSWDWVKEECLQGIHAFWADRIMTACALRGVISLIPKLGDLDFLTNWCTITMLFVIYKFISKIIATRMKGLM